MGQDLALEIGLYGLRQGHVFGVAQGAVGHWLALGLAFLAQDHLARFIPQGPLHGDGAIAEGLIGEEARQGGDLDLAALGGGGGRVSVSQDHPVSFLALGVGDRGQVGGFALAKQPGQFGDMFFAQFLALRAQGLAHLLPEA